MTAVQLKTDREVTIRARAFTGYGIEDVRCLVSPDGTVRAWDSVAGHFTMAHILSANAMQRARRIATDEQARLDAIEANYVALDRERSATLESVVQELRRVFGVPATVEPLANGLVSVTVEGWPDAITYRADRLFAVLVGFGDGHGSTEAGDAEVCATLERLGAVARSESL